MIDVVWAVAHVYLNVDSDICMTYHVIWRLCLMWRVMQVLTCTVMLVAIIDCKVGRGYDADGRVS